MEGGADTVIDALEEVLTPRGTLVMPTYSGQLIYILERLALDAGINGGGSGRGMVFKGNKRRLFEVLRHQADSGAVPFPFESPEHLVHRFLGERRNLNKNGWRFELKSAGSTVLLTRDAPPLAEDEIRPWKMPVWTGTIPEAFWHRRETIRSHQYSGSFTAWGAHAEEILQGHDDRPGQKLEDHPLYRLMTHGGKILLLGVDHRTNSSIHVAEWTAIAELKPEGMHPRAEFIEDFESINPILVKMHAQHETMIGSSTVRLVPSAAVFAAVHQKLVDLLEKQVTQRKASVINSRQRG